ncbi:MAG: hypothetical protein QGG40_18265, partial [Myxococcota bacterium]|nr:hypothetical protein [Myxococcota bacterium]
MSTWLLCAAFLTVVAYAAQQAVEVEAELHDERRLQAERELSTVVQLWEAWVLERANAWLLELSEAPDVAARERHHSATTDYFDGFYLWRPGPESLELLHPTPTRTQDLELALQQECIHAALGLIETHEHEAGATALESCVDVVPATRLIALNRAAEAWLNLDRPHDALGALESLEIPL